MARPTLENIRSLSNFTQLFRWEIAFSKAPKAIAFPGNDAINWRAESSSLPTFNPTASEVIIRGHKVKKPGVGDWGNTITLTMIETIDSVISQFISDWRFACWSVENGVQGLQYDKKDIEANILLVRLDNLDIPIWKYELIGCFPETTEAGGELGAEDSSPLKPSISISFDYFKEGKV